MVKGIKDLGNQRYRETFGRYFEDFEIGDIYEHRPGRTITQSDNCLLYTSDAADTRYV